MDYFEYCEELFKKWYSGELSTDNSIDSGIFDLTYMPEPYFILAEGKNPLYILNNNPGSGLDFQKKDYLETNINKEISYKNCISHISGFYKNGLEYNGSFFKQNYSQAHNRNMKALEFSEDNGYDGVVCVETLPFHSKSLPNKEKVLYECITNRAYLLYFRYLSELIKDKPVLIISAIGSSGTITRERIFGNEWRKFQVQLAGMKVSNAEIYNVCEKDNGKITSALVKDRDKYLFVQMGSNNLGKREKIKEAMVSGGERLHQITIDTNIGNRIEIIEVPFYGLTGTIVGEEDDKRIKIGLDLGDGIGLIIDRRYIRNLESYN